MKVLIDTTVWSLLLRRRKKSLGARERAVQMELRDLVTSGNAALIGPIRQELLTGIRETEDFERLRDRLQDFEDERLTETDFEEAARCANVCRAAGVAGSPVDFLLCALGVRGDLSIFTLDEDFRRYGDHLPIRFHPLP